MHFHGRHSSATPVPERGPSLPPLPTSTSSELRMLDPSRIELRRDGARLQMLLSEKQKIPVLMGAALERETSGGGAAAAEDGAASRDTAVQSDTDTAQSGGAETAVPIDGRAQEAPDKAGLAAELASAAVGGVGAPDAQAAEEKEASPLEWRDVALVRLFPLSEPNRWIAVLGSDGREIGILSDLWGLSPENARLVQEELQRRYIVPKVLAILSCRDRFDMVEWTMETDRGRVTFLTRNLRENIRQPLPNHLTLTDVQGNRYDIPDVARLDPDSQRWLREYI